MQLSMRIPVCKPLLKLSHNKLLKEQGYHSAIDKADPATKMRNLVEGYWGREQGRVEMSPQYLYPSRRRIV